MSWVTIILISFICGVCASLGIGGGIFLILYLSLFTSLSQLQAQGINLIFFLPIGLTSIIIHTKSKLVEWKKIVPAILVGTISVIIFSNLASLLGSKLITKLFALFIIFTGIKTLFKKH